MKKLLLIAFSFSMFVFSNNALACYCTPDDDCSCCYGDDKKTQCQKDKAQIDYLRAKQQALEACARNGNCVIQ